MHSPRECACSDFSGLLARHQTTHYIYMNRKTKIILIAVIVLIIAGMEMFPVIKRTFFSKDVTGDHIPAAQTRGQRALNVNAMVLGYDRLE